MRNIEDKVEVMKTVLIELVTSISDMAMAQQTVNRCFESDFDTLESRLEFMICNVEKRIDNLVFQLSKRLNCSELDID